MPYFLNSGPRPWPKADIIKRVSYMGGTHSLTFRLILIPIWECL